MHILSREAQQINLFQKEWTTLLFLLILLSLLLKLIHNYTISDEIGIIKKLKTKNISERELLLIYHLILDYMHKMIANHNQREKASKVDALTLFLAEILKSHKKNCDINLDPGCYCRKLRWLRQVDAYYLYDELKVGNLAEVLFFLEAMMESWLQKNKTKHTTTTVILYTYVYF